MSAPRLQEATCVMIRDYIKSNFLAQLAAVSADRADNLVVLDRPDTNSYFLYEGASGYRAPAIFIVSPEFDFQISENKANFIDGKVKVYVTAVVEDRDATQLQYKAWRYASALHGMLVEQSLTSTDNQVKLTVVVKNIKVSAKFQENSKESESLRAAFRREISLECDVVHRENY